MRKLLTILGIFISILTQAQPFIQRSGPGLTPVDDRLSAKLNLYIPHTHGLTLNGGLDTLGAVIYEDSSKHMWVRSLSGSTHIWQMILNAGDVVGGVSSFNTRTGAVVLTNSDVIAALGGTPLFNVTNYIAQGSGVTITGLGTLASPYVINATSGGAGTVTQFNFTNGNGITGTVTNSTSTPTLALGTSLNGIINANGSGFGTVTIGSGLNYSGGVLTATGGTSLNGLISGNGSIFTTASIGAGLTFSANTLTNTITNTNQLTNGSGYITNITGLISQGSNVTITGSGTSGSPYVINSTGGGGITASGNLSPIFTTSIVSSTLTFSLSNATANSVFGNNTGSSAAPVYYVPNTTTLNGWFSGTIQAAITLTTTGTGAATLTGATLNIPTNVQTLTYAQNALNNTLALTGVSTQTLLTATTNLAGLLDTARTRFVDSLKNGLKTFNLYVANGLHPSTVILDSFYLGGPLNQNTLIATAGFTMSMTGLPNKATALSTDSVLLIDNAGRWWKLPVPSGGGGAVASVSNADGSLTISPTTGSVVASLNLGHANTFTAAQTVNAAFATNNTVNLSGITYTAGGSTFDVLVTDTSASGKVWRQPYYQFDTTGFTAGSTFLTFNGTKLTLSVGGSGVNTIGTFSGTSHANGASISGSTLTLAVADATNPGLLSTVGQSIAGAKVFSGVATFPAATTSTASIVLTTSAGTNVTTPTSGMLWWNGTNLNFRTGSTTVDLLAGGGGAVSSVSNADGTLTISPTTGAVVASLALGHANTWTAAMTVNAAFTTNNAVTLSGLTYNAGGVKFDVLVQDTTTGIVSRQPYYQFDTAGFASGNTVVVFNGTKLIMGTSGTVNLATSVTGILPGANGGTGVANTGKTITIGGNFTTSGAFTTTLTETANTSVTLPTSGTLYGTASASITSAQLITSVSDETGSGVLVFATSPTLVTPVLGVATATSINKVTITAPTTSATLTLVTGSSLITAGAFATTLTATATTNSTLPSGTHTLAQLDGPSFSAATTTVPNMTLTTSAGTNVTSPTSGMLWWNGTNLNFRTGSTTVDLLVDGGVTSIGAFSGTSIANGASISGAVLTLGVADGTNPGMISTTTQAIAGNKSFSGLVEVGGTITGGTQGVFTVSGNVTSATTPNSRGYWLNIIDGNTYTETGAGGFFQNGSTAFIGTQTYTSGTATTYAAGSTLLLEGAPTAGTNITFTKAYALLVAGGNSGFNGNITGLAASTISSFGHYIASSTPGFTAGAGAGTSPTITINGTDQDGWVTVLTGTTPSGTGATIVTLTYGTAFANNSFVVLTPANAATAALSGITAVFTTAGVTVWTIASGTTGLTAATTYKWFYHAGGN